jgi:hypothetical protein
MLNSLAEKKKPQRRPPGLRSLSRNGALWARAAVLDEPAYPFKSFSISPFTASAQI